MKKKLTYLFLLVILYSCSSHEIKHSKESQMKMLYAKSLTFNYGTIYTKRYVEHSFILKNHFNKKITINKVKEGCSCMTTEYSKKIIFPNDTFHIKLKVDLKDIRGYFCKSALVFINNGEFYCMPQVSGICDK